MDVGAAWSTRDSTFKLNAARQVDYLEHCNEVFRARAAALIYTAFTNLICNREITYGRDK